LRQLYLNASNRVSVANLAAYERETFITFRPPAQTPFGS
jgi:hypothetical protein